jgi:para-aminobenzoate synthetase/4-amino-4-deoxychorismate lyase
MVGFVAYDAAPAFEPKFKVRGGYAGPLAFFIGGHPEVVRNPSFDDIEQKPLETWTADFDPGAYRRKVAAIIEGIGRGDYYQVNLTERFSAAIDDPSWVYERLHLAQPAPYSAFIQTAEMAVMSVSPELFLNRTGDMIESHPMKGTSRRGRWSEEDADLARQLMTSEKERAENVMIVDLIRNDMGRLAIPGSVEVPAMFTVEKYPTVLQMTSHVKSQLKPGTTLGDVFGALFPCGSVTGAPKIAASKSIAALEEMPRGVYCGAIGVVRPGAREFMFNVAIRTATVGARTGRAIYGAGGGITADSDPARELGELQAKAAVLTSLPRVICLLETLRLENGVVSRLDGHLRRLARSAAYFGYERIDAMIDAARRAIAEEASANPVGLFRLSLTAPLSGAPQARALPPGFAGGGPRRLRLVRTPVDSTNPALYHKLTDRLLYTDRRDEAGPDADDAIMVNERGELTETTIGNLVLELDGRKVTPALACGLLPGVFREALLHSGDIEEAILRPKDLKRATRVWMVNSLRGWVEAVITSAARDPHVD